MSLGLGIWKRKRGKNKMSDVKELSEVIEFVAELASALGKAAEDGKPTLSDAIYLAPLVYKLPSALDGAGKIPEEAANLDKEKMDALAEQFKEKLKLPQEKLEMAIEESLDIALRLYALVQKMKV
jgi:hypothetical protein